MSHSTVLVIGEDPEKMLAPYDEGLEVEPYRKYDDAKTPQDHWMFKILMEKHGLAADADWPSFVTAHNERYRDDPVYLTPKTGRVYTMSEYNPLSRWDWYLLGGRWTGYFKLEAGATGQTGEPGIMTPNAKVGWTDQARKRDIDFEGMREAAATEATELHAKASRALAGLPPLVAWDKVREEMFPDDIESARRYYYDQPGIRVLKEAELYFDDPVTYLCLDDSNPAVAYVARRRAEAGLTFAILDEQGWHERGRMGWFGVVHDESDDWASVGWAIIDAAADDALFSVYDVHI